MKRIGILGGTFNPIHIGHILLAEWAKDHCHLDEIWLIPTGRSYMKSDQIMPSGQERYEMVCKAIQEYPHMKCLDIEIKREGNSYTCDTLMCLHRLYPDCHFHFIFGADCLFSIENWKNPQQIFDHCTIIAAVRGNTSIEKMELKKEELVQKYHADICLLPFLQMDVSSTLIRERMEKKQSVKFLVPESVITYMKEKGYYAP